MNDRMEMALAGVVAENIALREERDQLQAIAAGACFRIAGLEMIILRDNMRIAGMELLAARLRGKGGGK